MERFTQKLAIVAAAVDSDPRRAITGARSLGFAGIAFDVVSASLDFTELSHTGMREFRQLLAASNQSLAALRFDPGPKGLAAGADIDRLLAKLTKVVQAAKSLALPPMVCVDVGPLPEPVRIEKPQPRIAPEQAGLILIPEPTKKIEPVAATPPPDPGLISRIDGILRELGDRADRVGVTLAFRSDVASFAALDRALTAAACPWFGIDLDPVAILRDAWTPDEIFPRLGSLIRHVRARDALVGADKRTRPAAIGQGSTNWRELLGNLDSANYRGWITIDPLELPDRIASAATGFAYFRDAAQT